MPHIRVKLGLEHRSHKATFPSPELKNDSGLDPADVAISFSGGEQVTFAALLSAMADPAGNMPCGSEGAAGSPGPCWQFFYIPLQSFLFI